MILTLIVMNYVQKGTGVYAISVTKLVSKLCDNCDRYETTETSYEEE